MRLHPAQAAQLMLSEDWVRRFVAAWRSVWGAAPDDVRRRGANGFLPLTGSVDVEVFVALGDVPVVAFAAVVRERPGPRGLRVGAKRVDSSELAVVQEGPLLVLRQLYETMRASWFPGRRLSPPLVPQGVCMGPEPGDAPGRYVVVAGAPAQLDPQALVRSWLTCDAPTPAVDAPPLVPRSPPRHLHSLGEEREAISVARWMFANNNALLRLLGIPWSWWVGVRLRKKSLFDDSRGGDVDIIGGPLEFDVSEAEWEARFEEEVSTHWLTADLALARQIVITKAAQEGRIRWPPSTEYVFAVEVKTSPFEDGRWRNTHEREGQKVKGQLRYLLKRGVNRVAYMHIGATKPRRTAGIPWVDADHDVKAAVSSFPSVYEPTDLPCCGYFRVLMGAIPDQEEHWGGVWSGPIVLQHATENPSTAHADSTWRMRLRGRLDAMPRPRTFGTYIAECRACGEWRHVPLPEAETNPCGCVEVPTPTRETG
jgi:hypothetical protein